MRLLGIYAEVQSSWSFLHGLGGPGRTPVGAFFSETIRAVADAVEKLALEAAVTSRLSYRIQSLRSATWKPARSLRSSIRSRLDRSKEVGMEEKELTAQEYRQLAEECERAAASANDRLEKLTYANLAERWRKLADDVERYGLARAIVGGS